MLVVAHTTGAYLKQGTAVPGLSGAVADCPSLHPPPPRTHGQLPAARQCLCLSKATWPGHCGLYPEREGREWGVSAAAPPRLSRTLVSAPPWLLPSSALCGSWFDASSTGSSSPSPHPLPPPPHVPTATPSGINHQLSNAWPDFPENHSKTGLLLLVAKQILRG